MKKKILICIHNYFFLEHYLQDIDQLNKDFDITIITSNYLIKDQKNVIEEILKKTNIHNFYLVPFYVNDLERNLRSIILSHFFLNKIKKKINFDLFDLCISDNKFFIWQKIILSSFLNTKCIQIGVHSGSLPLELSIFEKLLQGENIFELIKKVHKFREIQPMSRKKEKNFFQKFINIKKRFLDIYFDRYFLSLLFYQKNFNYKKYDLNIFETNHFDYKIVFHHANYIFWNKLYGEDKKKVFLSKHVNNCNCKNTNKDKIIFLSSILWEDEVEKISLQVNSILKFVRKILIEKPHIKNLHIKHHPMENDLKIEIINKIFEKKFKDLISITFLNKHVSTQTTECNYSLAFGMVSSVLVDFTNACNNIEVYCLESISTKELGEKYYLKLMNERITFLNEKNNIINEKANKYKEITSNIHKQNFPDLIRNIILS